MARHMRWLACLTAAVGIWAAPAWGRKCQQDEYGGCHDVTCRPKVCQQMLGCPCGELCPPLGRGAGMRAPRLTVWQGGRTGRQQERVTTWKRELADRLLTDF
ncbi:MAG: hypothetical protein NZT92_17445 [Abditibacteriales bacterium]|nr:hypothetical protein [Abditibacteriales bacterium]MDW8367634.1 hypothetical protein [Abditibacteriales bacterium]